MVFIFIIAQIIGLIAFSNSLLAYHKKTKQKILFQTIIANTLNLIHYLLLGAYSGFITKIIALIRDSLIIIKEKTKKRLNIILFILISIYLIFCYKIHSPLYSTIPFIAALIYTIPAWNGNDKTVRKAALISYLLWLTYSIFITSISGILSYSISIISTSIAITKYNQKKFKL